MRKIKSWKISGPAKFGTQVPGKENPLADIFGNRIVCYRIVRRGQFSARNFWKILKLKIPYNSGKL